MPPKTASIGGNTRRLTSAKPRRIERDRGARMSAEITRPISEDPTEQELNALLEKTGAKKVLLPVVVDEPFQGTNFIYASVGVEVLPVIHRWGAVLRIGETSIPDRKGGNCLVANILRIDEDRNQERMEQENQDGR